MFVQCSGTGVLLSGHGKEPRRLSVRMSDKVVREPLRTVVEGDDVRGTVTFLTLQRNI
jgi:hypothetical protein